MATEIQSEEQKIQQEISDRVQSNPTFFKALLSKTENISQSIYEKSPMKSEALVTNAKQIDEQLAKFVDLLDSNVNKTLNVYNDKMTSFQTQCKNQKTHIQGVLNNSTLIKKSNQYQNYLINTLEEHLNSIGQVFLKKEFVQQQSQANGEIEPLKQQLTMDQIVSRYMVLLDTASNIVFEIFNVYYKDFQKTDAFTRIQEVKIVQEILLDLAKVNLINPVFENVVDPSKQLVLKSQEFGKQQFQKLFAKLVEIKSNPQIVVTDTKVMFTQAYDFGQKKLEKILPYLKINFPELKNSIIKVYEGYFTITFAKQFFQNNYTKIQQALIKLFDLIKQTRVKSIESTKNYVNQQKEIYSNALKTFKERRQQLHESKKQQQQQN